MTELMAYLKPLTMTVLFETAAAFFFGIRQKDILLVILANIITNPPLVFICLLLMYHIGIGKAYLFTYLFLEPLVIVTEWKIYEKHMRTERNCLALSVLLNMISITGGIICQRMF